MAKSGFFVLFWCTVALSSLGELFNEQLNALEKGR